MAKKTTVILAISLALALTSCGSASDSASQKDARPLIATTVSPITSIAASIAGDRARIEGIVPEGVNSHTFEPSPQIAELLSKADLILVNGLKLEDPTLEMARLNKKEKTQIVEIGTLVLPEAEEVDVELNMNDVRVDVYRSSGPGGQSVNTTDSAVRLTHVPTGIVVSCQNEKSQLQNKESALRILRARLLADAQEKAEAIAMAERKSQVRTVDRSERIRTYNYPENRLSDHRVNYKSNNLDAVLNGELDDVVQALLDADKAAKLSSTE